VSSSRRAETLDTHFGSSHTSPTLPRHFLDFGERGVVQAPSFQLSAQLEEGLRATGALPWTQVQNPKAEQTFRGDVFALKTVVDAFAPQASPAFDEIQKQFATEFDYRGECANAVEVRANLVRSGRFPNVLVPRMHAALCTRRHGSRSVSSLSRSGLSTREARVS